MDYSLPGSPVQEILQVRMLEWVAMPSSKGSSRPMDQTQFPALQADSLPSGSPGYKDPNNVGHELVHGT